MNLQKEFDAYRAACYGDEKLSPSQLQEIEQAFLSGIVVAARSGCSAAELLRLTRNRLMLIGAFPVEGN